MFVLLGLGLGWLAMWVGVPMLGTFIVFKAMRWPNPPGYMQTGVFMVLAFLMWDNFHAKPPAQPAPAMPARQVTTPPQAESQAPSTQRL